MICALKLIFCLGGNRIYPALAAAAGWWHGARLPIPLYVDHLAFAAQQWTRFDGLRPGDVRYDHAYQRYITALSTAQPDMASVIDWTAERTRDEVLSWAVEAACHVRRQVLIIPKVPDVIGSIPREIGGKCIALGYSVPTRHGATPVDPAEFAGWPVHLLGGNPRQQIHYAGLLTTHGAKIISADGNLINKAAGKGTFWEHGRCRNLGARVLTTEEALRRSLVSVPQMWRNAGWEIEVPA